MMFVHQSHNLKKEMNSLAAAAAAIYDSVEKKNESESQSEWVGKPEGRTKEGREQMGRRRRM